MTDFNTFTDHLNAELAPSCNPW